MSKTYKQFINETLGKSYDVDHSYGPQCWDYVSGIYFPWIGGKIIHCGQTGYVKDIANQRYSNGILDFCDDIGFQTDMKPGDVAIWTNCPECPYSHIAIYDHDYGQSDVYFAGQNQPKPYVTIKKISVVGIIGVFRPKIFVQDDEGYKPTPDQMLQIGSMVISDPFELEAINYKKNTGYNKKIGGWFPLADVDEVEPAKDGKLDQIVHTGSIVQFNHGLPMRVTGIAAGNVITLDALSYPVRADLFTEIY
jgi:hypothetical protein